MLHRRDRDRYLSALLQPFGFHNTIFPIQIIANLIIQKDGPLFVDTKSRFVTSYGLFLILSSFLTSLKK